jgi:hypothetical protein
VNDAGQVFLFGKVNDEASRAKIEEEARSAAGVTGVFNFLVVQPPPHVPPSQVTSSTAPPPPAAPPAPAGFQPARPGPARDDAEQLTDRIYEALTAHPVLRSLTIAVNSSRGVVTIKGNVPSAYEAMLAYRTTEQTPGVESIVDELEFPPPDDEHPNPLRQGARSEDVGPFLTSRIRCCVDESAHIDRVLVAGDLIVIRGSVLKVEDKSRVEAKLRSMAILRDFRLTLVLTPYDHGDEE